MVTPSERLAELQIAWNKCVQEITAMLGEPPTRADYALIPNAYPEPQVGQTGTARIEAGGVHSTGARGTWVHLAQSAEIGFALHRPIGYVAFARRGEVSNFVPDQDERLSAYHDLVQALHAHLHPGETLNMLPHEVRPAWDDLLDEVRANQATAKTAEGMKQRLDIIERKVDRADLAKSLYLKRMQQSYGTIQQEALEDLWQDLDASYQNHWLTVADEAIRLLLATDVPRG